MSLLSTYLCICYRTSVLYQSVNNAISKPWSYQTARADSYSNQRSLLVALKIGCLLDSLENGDHDGDLEEDLSDHKLRQGL